MEGDRMENVVLMPQTVEYYQKELTRMLETERYDEAIRLLNFLLRCSSVDRRTEEEWQSLLDWLLTMFPEHGTGGEEEWSEEAIRRQVFRRKTESDHRYKDKLYGMLQQSDSPDKQMLALEQLMHIDDPGIDEYLKLWLCGQPLHPLIQFKGLQALKKRGETGTVSLPRSGKTILVNIEDTPLSPDEFPEQVAEVTHKLQHVSDSTEPELYPFAEQMWELFISSVYGTAVYSRLCGHGPEFADAWAAAIHTVLAEIVHGKADRRDIVELYGITSNLQREYHEAYQMLQAFIQGAQMK